MQPTHIVLQAVTSSLREASEPDESGSQDTAKQIRHIHYSTCSESQGSCAMAFSTPCIRELQMDVVSGQGCRAVGQAATVTSSEGNSIFELDHQTALLVVSTLTFLVCYLVCYHVAAPSVT